MTQEQSEAKKTRISVAQWVTEVGRSFPPLELVTKPGLTTDEAAYYLNRRPQTLRIWACREGGPIRPLRINGSRGLLWRTSDLRRLLGIDSTFVA